ncbi:MAG: DUF4388 domain-containing protein [Actinomycetes bacterium]
MKLEGSLDAFSLPDMFQLLSFTKKTGGLHLVSDGSDGVVFVADGRVTGASADGSRQPLARRLVGSGAVSDEALGAAVEAAVNGEGLGVVRALLEAGAVDADLLRQAATDQAVDAIFDLLRWRTGDFAFVVDETNPDDVGVSLAVESVLADAESRMSTWETVSQVVPSPQAVPSMPVVLGADPAVSRGEWSLLALVDGRRSVAELVDLTGSGQYAVVSTLAALVQRGLLEVRREGLDRRAEDADHVAVVVRRQELLGPLEAFTPAVDTSAAVPDSRASSEGGGREVTEAVADVAPFDGAGDEARTEDEPELATASAGNDQQSLLGGAHVPHDVVPPRPEPYLPKRQADFDEAAASPAVRPVHVASGALGSGVGDVVGATATAPDPKATSVIERDPNVNRSLMLRLIAGVRGL